MKYLIVLSILLTALIAKGDPQTDGKRYVMMSEPKNGLLTILDTETGRVWRERFDEHGQLIMCPEAYRTINGEMSLIPQDNMITVVWKEPIQTQPIQSTGGAPFLRPDYAATP